MARNKRPALTSPWKIGFLVSLLLVAMSIGVGYFITRSFNLTWTWIQFNGSWNDWTFRRDPFMTEMLPLAALVPVLCMLSYLLVTGAVRRYRAYLDSGLDYKNLIQSLNSIDDIKDEKSIRGLGNHPKLRDFLLNIRAGVIERETEFENRKAEIAEQEALAARYGSVSAECTTLVDAVAEGRSGPLSGEMEFENDEVRAVADAIRESLLAPAEDDTLDEVRATVQALRSRLDDICDEVTAGMDMARELESEITRVRNTSAASDGGRADAPAEAMRVISRLDNISEVLRGLGEETRTVAVKTALQASSPDGGIESVITLADEVRDVAAKFNGVSEQWDEASESARGAMQSMSSGAGTGVSASVDAVATKAGLWVERSVVLNEKLRAFRGHYADAVRALDPDAAPQESEPADTTGFQTWDEGADTDNLALDRAGDNGAFETEDTPDVSPEPEGVELEGFVKQKAVFEETAPPEGDGMFADIPEAAGPVAAESETDTPPQADTRADDSLAAKTESDEDPTSFQTLEGLESTSYGPAAEPASDAQASPKPEPASTEADSDEETGEKIYDIDPEPYDPHAATPGLPDLEPTSMSSEKKSVAVAEEEDVVDLYELGAVDYEPDNVHHNV